MNPRPFGIEPESTALDHSATSTFYSNTLNPPYFLLLHQRKLNLLSTSPEQIHKTKIKKFIENQYKSKINKFFEKTSKIQLDFHSATLNWLILIIWFISTFNRP